MNREGKHRLDTRSLGMHTRTVHAGEAHGPDDGRGREQANLVMSTSFVVEDASGSFYSAMGNADDGAFVYTRWANPTVQQLERLAELEGGEAAVAFASGMAAAAGVLLRVLKAGDHLVISDARIRACASWSARRWASWAWR